MLRQKHGKGSSMKASLNHSQHLSSHPQQRRLQGKRVFTEHVRAGLVLLLESSPRRTQIPKGPPPRPTKSAARTFDPSHSVLHSSQIFTCSRYIKAKATLQPVFYITPKQYFTMQDPVQQIWSILHLIIGLTPQTPSDFHHGTAVSFSTLKYRLSKVIEQLAWNIKD